MGALFSLLWKALAGLAAALGAAVVARAYTQAPRKLPVLSGLAAHDRDAANEDGRGERAALQPGWSRPKPEVIPRPTYWPMVFAAGIAFICWGLVSSLWVFGLGFILFIVGLTGWIGDLLHE